MPMHSRPRDLNFYVHVNAAMQRTKITVFKTDGHSYTISFKTRDQANKAAVNLSANPKVDRVVIL